MTNWKENLSKLLQEPEGDKTLYKSFIEKFYLKTKDIFCQIGARKKGFIEINLLATTEENLNNSNKLYPHITEALNFFYILVHRSFQIE